MRIQADDYIKNLDRRYKIAFFSAFIIGIISQGMGLFNKFSVHDDPFYFSDVGATYTSGRWMLDLLSIFEERFFGDGHYSLPAFNGFLAIILIAVSACLVIKILDIRSDVSCAFLAGLMVAFPVITSIFGYLFTLHFYMIALFIGTLGAYCICLSEKWYVWLLGAVLVGASVGIYQAFVSFSVTIILFYHIKKTYESDDLKDVIKKILISGIICCLFMGIYFVVCKLYLKYKDAVLTDYQGINMMGKSSLSEYMHRSIDAYREFFFPNANADYCMYPGTLLIIYKVIMFLAILFSIIGFFELFKRNKFRALIFGFLVMLIPLCTNSIFVMAGREAIHSIMIYAQLLPFVYFICIVENTHIKIKYIEQGISLFSTVIFLAVLIMYVRVDNKCYLRVTYAQQEAISYFTSMVAQIKCTEGYRDEYPVVFINEGQNVDTSLQPGDDGALFYMNYAPYRLHVRFLVTDYSWIQFMRQWTGYSPVIGDPEMFMDMEVVQNMSSYPDDGSIMVIDQTVVVKF